METAKAVSLSITDMVWESNMIRDQKEKYVLELYQHGRTVRHIAWAHQFLSPLCDSDLPEMKLVML